MPHISRFVAIFEADTVKDITWAPHAAKRYKNSQSYLLVGTSTRQTLHDKTLRRIPGTTTPIKTPGYVTEYAHAIEDVHSGILASALSKWGDQIDITYVPNVEKLVEALQKNLAAEKAEQAPGPEQAIRHIESLYGPPPLPVRAM